MRFFVVVFLFLFLMYWHRASSSLSLSLEECIFFWSCIVSDKRNCEREFCIHENIIAYFAVAIAVACSTSLAAARYRFLQYTISYCVPPNELYCVSPHKFAYFYLNNNSFFFLSLSVWVPFALRLTLLLVYSLMLTQ